MKPEICAIVAASIYAFSSGKKVAGLYDHGGAKHLRIAAEAQGEHLQGYDGDRNSRFGGSLPELRDVTAGASVHLTVKDGVVQGFDRSSSSHFSARVSEGLVQIYDHSAAAWLSYEIQTE